jgi:hypothetical protein
MIYPKGYKGGERSVQHFIKNSEFSFEFIKDEVNGVTDKSTEGMAGTKK